MCVDLGMRLCIHAREFTQLSVQPYIPLAMKEAVITIVQLDCCTKATRKDFHTVKHMITMDSAAKCKQIAS